MKHSSVNGLVNEKTVSDSYNMLLENSRKYLDVQPAAPLAGATQAKGKDYLMLRSSRLVGIFLRIHVSSVDQWITG